MAGKNHFVFFLRNLQSDNIQLNPLQKDIWLYFSRGHSFHLHIFVSKQVNPIGTDPTFNLSFAPIFNRSTFFSFFATLVEFICNKIYNTDERLMKNQQNRHLINKTKPSNRINRKQMFLLSKSVSTKRWKWKIVWINEISSVSCVMFIDLCSM